MSRDGRVIFLYYWWVYTYLYLGDGSELFIEFDSTSVLAARTPTSASAVANRVGFKRVNPHTGYDTECSSSDRMEV